MRHILFCSADLGAVLNPSGYKLSVVGTVQTGVLTSVPPVHLAASQAVPTAGM